MDNVLCKVCGKFVSKANYARHHKSHFEALSERINLKTTPQDPQKAIHMNIATKASLRNHIVRNIQVHVNYQFQVFAQYAIKHLRIEVPLRSIKRHILDLNVSFAKNTLKQGKLC